MSRARIAWIGGPVLRARAEGPFSIFEALDIGPRCLLGEVIQLRDDEIVAQVYEDTTGLEPGTVVVGPGLLGGIFDGLLRPLTGTDDFQIRPGLCSLHQVRCNLEFKVREGDTLEPGAVFATVIAPRTQWLLVPPRAQGTVEHVVDDGEHGERETLVVLRGPDDVLHELRMHHDWPVRRPRPVRER